MQETKICRVCKEEKLITDFPFRNKPTKRRAQCWICYRIVRKRIYKNYYKKHNKERRMRWHKDPFYRKRNKIAAKKYREKNKEALRLKYKKDRRKRKELVFSKYGGKCDCCGENKYEFLSIDHINGNGHAERKKISVNALYIKLSKNKKRLKNYRLLCFNCNCSLGFYGYCPHLR